MKPVGIYKQTAASLATWKSRGASFAFGYEGQNGADGKPTVSMAQWKAACVAAGLDYICEPSDNLAADVADKHLIAWLWPVDEIDDKWLGGDQSSAPAPVAAGVAKLVALGKPVVANTDGWQSLWKKYDYKTAFSTGAKLATDYYFVPRETTAEFLGLVLDNVVALSGKPLAYAFVGTCFSHADPKYFPHDRAPTVAEFLAGMKQITDRGGVPVLFPQSFAPFNYDATPPDILAALAAYAAPAATPAPVTVDPLDGSTAVIGGRKYTLKAQ